MDKSVCNSKIVKGKSFLIDSILCPQSPKIEEENEDLNVDSDSSFAEEDESISFPERYHGLEVDEELENNVHSIHGDDKDSLTGSKQGSGQRSLTVPLLKPYPIYSTLASFHHLFPSSTRNEGIFFVFNY